MPAQPVVDIHSHKRPMEYEELRDVISLALWAGQMLLQNGADTARVEETVHRLGTGLGCDWMDVAVFHDAIIASTINNFEFRTKVRRAPGRSVNLELIAQVSDLSYAVSAGQMDRFALRAALRRVDQMPPNYSRLTVTLGVALACAAFSRLFGGDWLVFLFVFAAAALAMGLRQLLHQRYVNLHLITFVTALVAALVASLSRFVVARPAMDIAIAAAVLLLVPGVQLINSAEDLIRGHITTGIARGVLGLLVSLSIALGISAALWIMGINAR